MSSCFSQAGLYSIPLDNSLLPSFWISHISPSILSSTPPPFLFSRWSHVQWDLRGAGERKGDRLLYNSKLEALVCVCAWGTGQLGHTHHTRAMSTGWWPAFSTGPRPPRQIMISHEQQAVLYLSMCWIKCRKGLEVEIDGPWIKHCWKSTVAHLWGLVVERARRVK